MIGDLEAKIGELGENVDNFISNNCGIIGENNSQVQKKLTDFKKKTADGYIN